MTSSRLSQLGVALVLMMSTLAAVPALAKDEAPLGAIWALDLDGAVGPATSDYLVRSIETAQQRDARLVVIRMNTPGGLDGAMRDIIEAILGSSVPIAAYVAPQGARAASAGTYILYASHIAAMAPATNLGAATPVPLGAPGPPSMPAPEADKEGGDEQASPAQGTAMERKIVNDAAAYIRGLAMLRGRNVEWAEEAVREAASLASEEALERSVIDLLATSLRDLVAQADGREVQLPGGPLTLDLADAPLFEAVPDWRTEFLTIITNPSLVLILGMIGFYGIILEFYNPGSLVPGTIGVICLLLAGYALQLLPVNYAGLALILVGIALIVAEALSPSFGILGFGGLAAFTIGGVIMFDTDVEQFQVAWQLLAALAFFGGLLIIVTITMLMRMRERAVSTGIEQMLGAAGEVLRDFDGAGQVRVGGEIWEAHSAEPLKAGERVIIRNIDGLKLSVEKEQST